MKPAATLLLILIAAYAIGMRFGGFAPGIYGGFQ